VSNNSIQLCSHDGIEGFKSCAALYLTQQRAIARVMVIVVIAGESAIRPAVILWVRIDQDNVLGQTGYSGALMETVDTRLKLAHVLKTGASLVAARSSVVWVELPGTLIELELNERTPPFLP
jgi:hypothetical protein